MLEYVGSIQIIYPFIQGWWALVGFSTGKLLAPTFNGFQWRMVSCIPSHIASSFELKEHNSVSMHVEFYSHHHNKFITFLRL